MYASSGVSLPPDLKTNAWKKISLFLFTPKKKSLKMKSGYGEYRTLWICLLLIVISETKHFQYLKWRLVSVICWEGEGNNRQSVLSTIERENCLFSNVELSERMVLSSVDSGRRIGFHHGLFDTDTWRLTCTLAHYCRQSIILQVRPVNILWH